ncbi:SAM-dependent methyltransferase [Alteriqipengyuania lutimaris]|uniref:Class I SAM-dependent methyltransferase n=1 Tax=Alteriqipengyuania lutimaris TaxID=1538146 RepID=A0A395LMJ8_9SPHN|nr:cyclopropane-fatty-acyl-phospholipid synthase family protein [Alteriqipengyuania lutimaris]MBB3035255.1 cyclopropane-fatty-acyl-phospholipid synthase [Alteriqipengyuania lutimaris]RDS75850.1 class I SAM-dependent methyltransferase [Alteriqipengyuania lutimaris]
MSNRNHTDLIDNGGTRSPASVLLSRYLSGQITSGSLEVRFADGTREHFGQREADGAGIAIRFTDGRVPREMLIDPALGAAEAFMDDRLIIERGDIMQMIALFARNAPWEAGASYTRPHVLKKIVNRIAFHGEQVNNAVRSRANVSHHYDIGNDLYRLMLDAEHMQYSCGYWPEDRGGKALSLAQAQEAKLAHIAAKLALEPGQRVLDIGCGWGGMAMFLASRADVHVTGITLSEEQAALARERVAEAGLADKVSIELVDYRDHANAGAKYDRIVSVGMFEHVGQAQFDSFFRCTGKMLKVDGVMLVHTIGRMGPPGSTDAFTRKYIFPGGYIPALSETVAASEKCRLIATDVETWRLHYAHTLRAWYANCEANRDAIVRMYDERFYRMWTFYLAGAAAAFESGAMCNYQIQYARHRHALPYTRDYMAEAEANLLTRG